jgi:hypothetical protein
MKRYYGEALYSIASDLLGGVMVGPVSEKNVEINVFTESGGITVGVRLEATGYAEAFDLLTHYGKRAAASIQQAGLVVPDPYKLNVWDCAGLEAHMWFESELAEDDSHER